MGMMERDGDTGPGQKDETKTGGAKDSKVNFASQGAFQSKSTMHLREEKEKVPKQSFADRLIIDKNSKWKAIFDILILLLVGYSCITSIFYVAFSSPDSTLHLAFDWGVEVFFI